MFIPEIFWKVFLKWRQRKRWNRTKVGGGWGRKRRGRTLVSPWPHLACLSLFLSLVLSPTRIVSLVLSSHWCEPQVRREIVQNSTEKTLEWKIIKSVDYATFPSKFGAYRLHSFTPPPNSFLLSFLRSSYTLVVFIMCTYKDTFPYLMKLIHLYSNIFSMSDPRVKELRSLVSAHLSPYYDTYFNLLRWIQVR